MPGNIFSVHAHKYAALGRSIFPLAKGEKVPMARTNGFNSASCNRAQISFWSDRHPHANIGIATGKVSNIVVVDFDPRAGSRETVARFAREGKTFVDTVV